MNEDQFERIERIDIVVHEENPTEFGDVTQDDPQPVDVYNWIVRLEETLKNAWAAQTEEVKFIINSIDNGIKKLRTEVLQLKISHLRVGSSVVIIKDRKIGYFLPTYGIAPFRILSFQILDIFLLVNVNLKTNIIFYTKYIPAQSCTIFI